MSKVPTSRVRSPNGAPPSPRGDFVLYWMTTARRSHDNFALDRAVEWACELDRPLVVLEALRVDYPYASERFHAFVLQGMADNARAFARERVLYHPYVEPERGAGSGLIRALGASAAVVVGDDYPCFFIPRMLERAARELRVRFELVDGNGLLPLRAAEKDFYRAYDFRRFLQKTLPAELAFVPRKNALARGRGPARVARLPREIVERWPRASDALLAAEPAALAALPVDHRVRPTPLAGGARAGARRLASFVRADLERYAESRHPDRGALSGLSPYLHFGHVGAHQVLRAVAEHEGGLGAIGAGPSRGQKAGFWGMSEPTEAFLDQAVTWRELGFNFCTFRDDYARFESLPDWARRTLESHASDRREVSYPLATLERAGTHDAVWNAAERQLLGEGRIQSYLRMLWGKKILEWSPSPREALARMLELNDRYALDGRDPNSYSGIFWCLGRYDRPWAPERPIFGSVRYMSSKSTLRKLELASYLERYALTPL